MNLQQLRQALESSKIVPSSYSIGRSLDEEQYVIEEVRPDLWVTYYAERGLRSGLVEFKREADACIHFLQVLKKDAGAG